MSESRDILLRELMAFDAAEPHAVERLHNLKERAIAVAGIEAVVEAERIAYLDAVTDAPVRAKQ